MVLYVSEFATNFQIQIILSNRLNVWSSGSSLTKNSPWPNGSGRRP